MKVNDQISSKGLYYLNNSELEEFNFDNSKTILCAVPGAFTPGCTNHLKGFAENIKSFYEKGVKRIIFVSINDAYVMNEWNKVTGHPDIFCASDPLGLFTKTLEQEKDWGESFGIRSNRYALLVQDRKISHVFSSPFHETVLNEL